MFQIVPVTLTLAGIAAFVLSVGMAVDANILIFERTKEELRAGKTLATAVEAGFQPSLELHPGLERVIADHRLHPLLRRVVDIKGFALVLIIGVATSMFTAVTVSRTLLRSVIHLQSLQKAWLFGVIGRRVPGSSHGRTTRPTGDPRSCLTSSASANWFFLFSGLILIPGLIFILLTPITNGKSGLKFSIDYTGGTVWQFEFKNPNASIDDVKAPSRRWASPTSRSPRTRRTCSDPDQERGL